MYSRRRHGVSACPASISFRLVAADTVGPAMSRPARDATVYGSDKVSLVSLAHDRLEPVYVPQSPGQVWRRLQGQRYRSDDLQSPNNTVAEWLGLRRRRARVEIAVATLSGNSLRHTVHTHRASVHQAAKLAAALLRVAGSNSRPGEK